nr:2-C-methyl-D-erythritol 4-phosphate cytidylyltransferase [Planctomycetota bacterium]
MRASLLIPAAGSGTRFGGEMPKQLLTLAGETILLRSVRAFARLVDECIIATSAALVATVEDLVASAKPGMPVRIIVGGDERRDSVHAALKASDPASAVVLV